MYSFAVKGAGHLLLRETASRDLPTARRLALLRLIWQEACLTRESLITRVEILLERDCFGQSPQDTFHRDMAVVRQALAAAGHRLVCSRGRGRTGYYIEGRPSLDERMQQLIAGAAAEVDPRQIAVSRRLSPAQRFQQGRSMTELAERVEAYRLRQRQPELSEGATRHVVQEKGSPEMTEASMDSTETTERGAPLSGIQWFNPPARPLTSPPRCPAAPSCSSRTWANLTSAPASRGRVAARLDGIHASVLQSQWRSASHTLADWHWQMRLDHEHIGGDVMVGFTSKA